ncbi:hypothetical protein M436DRAFT_63497 [Aureobasidium namibiae CBS 147.97]|uniref:Uncharacterized protein n=1 Tax=Aureobasidium namibiae CBS 147.97 TaxID=1043004 RepID=A0A074WJ77_9PEZI|nr:uncharacterized protein M436DRAFT_63497 [Aureobasidium namibiae CBS 147.97]KEQ73175.1 hypothetical protein M436DRAFT_63497 [Aureobasidium namibiae CBS 147.97]
MYWVRNLWARLHGKNSQLFASRSRTAIRSGYLLRQVVRICGKILDTVVLETDCDDFLRDLYHREIDLLQIVLNLLMIKANCLQMRFLAKVGKGNVCSHDSFFVGFKVSHHERSWLYDLPGIRGLIWMPSRLFKRVPSTTRLSPSKPRAPWRIPTRPDYGDLPSLYSRHLCRSVQPVYIRRDTDVCCASSSYILG